MRFAVWQLVFATNIVVGREWHFVVGRQQALRGSLVGRRGLKRPLEARSELCSVHSSIALHFRAPLPIYGTIDKANGPKSLANLSTVVECL